MVDFQSSLLSKLDLVLGNTLPDILEASLLTILVTVYLFLESPQIQQAWEVFGSLFLVFALLMVVLYKVQEIESINKVLLDRQEVFFLSEKLEYLIWDQRFYAGPFSGDGKKQYLFQEFLCLNYHLIGFAKKILFFIILVLLQDSIQVQFSLIYSILGILAISSLYHRSHRSSLLTFLKSLNDFIQIGYFITLNLMNGKMRYLENKSSAHLSSLSE